MNYLNLIGKDIQFTANIEDMEAYPEGGMRARIVNIIAYDTRNENPEEHLYKIVFDYSKFDQFNALLETSNYYDKNGIACLTAREANRYEEVETIWFGSPEIYPFEKYFTLLNEKSQTLFDRFKESGASNYIEWLEDQIA
jgi:hypothetical protein